MPTRLSAETAELIAQHWPDLLDQIADGLSLDEACRSLPFTRSQVFAFRRISGREVQKQFADAFQSGAYAAADDIRATISSPDIDPKFARVRLQGLQWLAEKRDPDLFGQRIKAEYTVQNFDMNQILTSANARLEGIRSQRVIEGQATEIKDPLPLDIKDLMK